MTFTIRLLSDADLWWPDTGNPSVMIGVGTYRSGTIVNPRPAYRHDLIAVREALAECEASHPLTGSVGELAVLDHDFVTGFNGFARPEPIYKRPDGSDWDVEFVCGCGCGKPLKQQGQGLTIAMAAKTVPPLVAFTRYLVGHEYGHCAWYHAKRLQGWSLSDKTRTEREYMQVRGIDAWEDGKRWHELAVEIIANDFRLLIVEMAVEHWPHDVPRPEFGSAIHEWWQRAGELSKRGCDGDVHPLPVVEAVA